MGSEPDWLQFCQVTALQWARLSGRLLPGKQPLKKLRRGEPQARQPDHAASLRCTEVGRNSAIIIEAYYIVYTRARGIFDAFYRQIGGFLAFVACRSVNQAVAAFATSRFQETASRPADCGPAQVPSAAAAARAVQRRSLSCAPLVAGFISASWFASLAHSSIT